MFGCGTRRKNVHFFPPLPAAPARGFCGGMYVLSSRGLFAADPGLDCPWQRTALQAWRVSVGRNLYSGEREPGAAVPPPLPEWPPGVLTAGCALLALLSFFQLFCSAGRAPAGKDLPLHAAP